ncbi:hypothetical protein ABE099_17280 [Paenibacillus turicensis]|uniref:hypothetical protein n=1 Tax=Paenibacillus turicensis TaxID=160487 RepID=UPI003D291BE9
MRIIDTYTEIISLFSQREFSISLWRSYANSISIYLGQQVENDAQLYNIEKQVIPVINNALDNREKLEETHQSFIYATKQLRNKFIEIFKYDLDVDIILYLGLCNGAGWATDINGKKTVLLGIEKIIELDWCDLQSISSLIYHELGHIWHDSIGKLHLKTDIHSEKSIWQLYREGIAMYFEQMLCNDFSFYHQDRNGWLNWCIKNKGNLFIEYMRRVENEESTQEFFGDWSNYQGYSDVGYYLGCEFIKSLLTNYSLIEIANLNLEAITKELKNYKFTSST